MRIYHGSYFDSHSENIRQNIIKELQSQSDDYILNVSASDLTDHLGSKFELDTPKFHFELSTVDIEERDIPGSHFPSGFTIWDEHKTFSKNVFVYHVPYEGDIDLLKIRPNPTPLNIYEIEIDSRKKCLLIEIIDFYGDVEKIKKQYQEETQRLIRTFNYLEVNCESFNRGLKTFIATEIEKRKAKVLEKKNALSSLGVPIRSNPKTSTTFAVPRPQLREKIIIKPVVHDGDFKPEPTLDSLNHRRILKIISDVGKNFERMPSTYRGKSEEDIRDHILLVLDPNFEMGSASGETFNFTGKTDISLRYDSKVVFIAECKYWKGEKTLLATIDQLLGYLTWRDSKVAIVNFVRTADFSDILEKVKSSIKKHPNFLKELPDKEETWFNYKFHLNNDRNRELDLAVISFHLPK